MQSWCPSHRLVMHLQFSLHFLHLPNSARLVLLYFNLNVSPLLHLLLLLLLLIWHSCPSYPLAVIFFSFLFQLTRNPQHVFKSFCIVPLFFCPACLPCCIYLNFLTFSFQFYFIFCHFILYSLHIHFIFPFVLIFIIHITFHIQFIFHFIFISCFPSYSVLLFLFHFIICISFYTNFHYSYFLSYSPSLFIFSFIFTFIFHISCHINFRYSYFI